VAYSVSDSGSVIVDDLSYDNGQGTLVLVTTPGSTYMNVRNLALPGSVEGILHGHGAGKLTFRAVWTIGNQTQGDSAVIVANHESFTLQIPHHSI
jgi:hypothetical protein